MIRPSRLTRAALPGAALTLARRDSDLARVLADYGPPPLWSRPAGFATLIQIILEQQVSLASARAAYQRVVTAAGRLTPERFLTLDDADLKAAGFSRQKAGYGRELARALLDGRLDLAAVGRLPDDQARAALLAVKGIGPWSADIYLLMALRRPDIWPTGDLALASAAQRLKGWAALPDSAALAGLAEAWRPWRALGARLLWHYYLSAPRGRAPGKPAAA